MAWVRAKLRDQLVYARANDQGELAAESGRVEIRYRPHDGRRYRAGLRNLTVADPTPLPDDTCGPAEAVKRREGSAAAKAQTEPPPPDALVVDGESSAASPELLAGKVVAYTDGACSGNPGPAGSGVVLLAGDERIEISEYLGRATNNVAELTAVLRALEHVHNNCELLIHTDSKYTIGVVQKGWKAKANAELVGQLRAALKRHPLAKLSYVPGHAGVALNERADELARQAVSSCRTTRAVFSASDP